MFEAVNQELLNQELTTDGCVPRRGKMLSVAQTLTRSQTLLRFFRRSTTSALRSFDDQVIAVL